jgi:hypothetical protein
MSFGILEGARVLASDGTFLGVLTAQAIHPDAINNPAGVHGNEISATSIFNQAGLFGNEVSPQSAFNSTASNPPKVFRNGSFLGYLTTNTERSPRIDPRRLFAGSKKP